MSDLISVIVPIYNTGQYLRKCIDSILNQDYPNFEIILVDDGSKDETTIKLCDSYASRHPNIVLTRKENGGSSSARNAGIKVAKGEYICFIDSDDYIETDMLSDLYRFIKKYHTRIVFFELEYDNYKGFNRPGSIPNEGVYDKLKILHYFLLGYWHSACTAMYNRKVFEHHLFPTGEANEDYIFKFNLICDEEKIAICRKNYYHYVLRNGSNTQSNCNPNNLDWLKHTKFVLRAIQSSSIYHSLQGEARYQYLISNIILCNKALLSMSKGFYDSSNTVYEIASKNLKACKKWIIKNPFLRFRYRLMAYIIMFSPSLYRRTILLLLSIKNKRHNCGK